MELNKEDRKRILALILGTIFFIGLGVSALNLWLIPTVCFLILVCLVFTFFGDYL